MTQAQRDVVARSIDTIVDAIGLDNIRLFLPLWETSGSVASCIVNRHKKFNIVGATLNQLGPFGPCMSFDGVNDYVIEAPLTEATAGTAELALTSGTMKAAQRIKKLTASIGFVRLKLKCVGTLSSATMRITICEDNAGVPGNVVATSDSCACAIGSTFATRGFTLPTVFGIRQDKTYWVVLEYVNATGVDASNYIVWQYETGANTYGEARAVFDGSSWTVTAGENHVFGVYSDTFVLPDDFSVIALGKADITSIAWYYLLSSSGMSVDATLVFTVTNAQDFQMRVNDGGSRMVTYYRTPSVFETYGLTFSKANSTAKVKGYVNGRLIGTVDGMAGAAQVRFSQPLTLGVAILRSGALSQYWKGHIGAVIVTQNELTAAQMGKVSNALFALRKLQIAV